MSRFADTIAALATPVGTSAIAVLRISGAETTRIATELLGRAPPPRTATRGDYRTRDGAMLDDVLCTFFQEPRSYTGEDSLEIACHGNPLIAQKILEDLFARGCRPAEPGEFTQRAFVNGRMDLSQAEAVVDLIHARSERALAAANQQLRGELGRRVNAVVQELVTTIARVEAYIDFPEEDLPPEDRQLVLAALQHAEQETGRLLATTRYGELLRDGIKTVIIGPPNAGKSSLLNRLVGRDRALVSAEPGTTRDFLEERIIVGPHCLRLIDTAGLNSQPAELEKLGIQKTLERCQEADLFLIVREVGDNSPLPSVIPRERLSKKNTLVVVNKIDLKRDEKRLSDSLVSEYQCIEISALTGEGIESLKTLITKMMDNFQHDCGADSVAINARHALALETARNSLSAARQRISGEDGEIELLAADLRGALEAFGEIGGKVDNEKVLDALFATFCIGK